MYNETVFSSEPTKPRNHCNPLIEKYLSCVERQLQRWKRYKSLYTQHYETSYFSFKMQQYSCFSFKTLKMNTYFTLFGNPLLWPNFFFSFLILWFWCVFLSISNLMVLMCFSISLDIQKPRRWTYSRSNNIRRKNFLILFPARNGVAYWWKPIRNMLIVGNLFYGIVSIMI